MPSPAPSLDLMQFVETNILPRYNAFDRAHRLPHVSHVIRESIELAAKIGADIDMAYTVAAYHDLGLSGPRAIHHLTSGRILMADRRLSRWFSPSQIQVMREAVEDHRASAAKEPRNIYGRIVAEADRELDPDTVIRRTVEYGLDHYPELDVDGHWQRLCEHLTDKYSRHGYIRLWISESPNAARLAALRDIIADRAELRRRFEAVWNDCAKGGDTQANHENTLRSMAERNENNH